MIFLHRYCVMMIVCLVAGMPLATGNAAAEDPHRADSLFGERVMTEAASDAEGGLLQGEEALALLASMQAERYTEVPEHGVYDRGFTTAELLRDFGIVAVILALIVLFTVHFLDISRSSYRWALLIAMLILPFIASLSAMTTTLEETKTVASCQSCHVMDPFVDDMLNPESTTLAARHYENRWIPKQQCYECHTTYGVHGTLEGKRDGFRHWLLFVTRSWEEPITYAGSYPNANCTACHANSPVFEQVESHQSLNLELQTDRVTCTTCHGPPHPLPGERYPEPASQQELTTVDDAIE